MTMKIKWVMVKVDGTHGEESNAAGNCTTYKGSGSPATVTIKDAAGTTLPPIHLDTGATVEVCDSGVATVKGESKRRPKGRRQ